MGPAVVQMGTFVMVNSENAVLPTVFGEYTVTTSPLREYCLTESLD